jgi:hypothetical protein
MERDGVPCRHHRRVAILQTRHRLLDDGAFPANECSKMIVEKQIAAIEAMAAAWKALPTNDPVGIGTAVLRPYRRQTRANARRLSRSRPSK